MKRKQLSSIAASFVILGGLLLVAVPTRESFAESKKISGSGSATAVLSETKMLPGDDPSHVITFLRRLDTDKNDQFGDGQATIVNVDDAVAGTGPHRGYRIWTGTSGDQSFVAYEGRTTAVVKPSGPPEATFQGKWWYTGGTGKFQGITGGGTYRGALDAKGLTYQYEGDYEMKK